MSRLPSCEEYEISINVPRLIKCKELCGGKVDKNDVGTTINYVGGFCIVFPFYKSNGEKIAVRCWIAKVEDSKERARIIAEELRRANLPYFVNFKYVPEGLSTNAGVQPIVLMDWVEARSLKEYLALNLRNRDTLIALAEAFKQMVTDLHRARLSHGDLQHGNIMVKDDGSLVLVDYDSMYVPSLSGYKDEIKGLLGYQHPARWKNIEATEKADYFSELIIFTSIIALAYHPELWTELKIEDSETLVFSAEDIKSKGSSRIFTRLSGCNALAPLIETIKQALLCNSIDELLPLEEAIVPQEERIATRIRGQWNRLQMPSSEEFSPDTSVMRTKWNNS